MKLTPPTFIKELSGPFFTKGSLVLVGLLSFGVAQAELDFKVFEDPEADPTRNSYVEFQYDDLSLNNARDIATAASRIQQTNKINFGISNILLQNEEPDEWAVTLSGKALRFPDDINLKLLLKKSDNFKLSIHWNRWQDYSSPYGVWFPALDLWYPADDEAFSLTSDRLRVLLSYRTETDFLFKLEYQYRGTRGSKASTHYGTTGALRPVTLRGSGIIPSVQTLDRESHRASISMTKAISDESRIKVKWTVEETESDKKLAARRMAGTPGFDRYQSQTTGSSSSWINGYAYYERILNDAWKFSSGMSYTRLNGDLTGSRIIGDSVDPIYDPDSTVRQLNEAGFLNLISDHHIDTWTINSNLVYRPSDNWKFVVAAKLKKSSQDAFSKYLGTERRADWQALQIVNDESDITAMSDKSIDEYELALRSQYLGFSKVRFYFDVSYDLEDGNLSETWNSTRVEPSALPQLNLLDRLNDYERESYLIKLGASYQPFPSLKLNLEAYSKNRNNNFNHLRTLREPADYTDYPNYILGHDFKVKDINLRAYWTPFSSLKSVTRIDYQESENTTTSIDYAPMLSAERRRVLINQTFTWTPHPRIFLQVNGLRVVDETESPIEQISGYYEGIVIQVPNDYWQGSLATYLVVTKLIDLEVQYTVLDMDNFTDNTPTSVAYGEDSTDQYIKASAHFHFNEALRLTAGYGFYKLDHDSSNNRLDTEVNQIFLRLLWNF